MLKIFSSFAVHLKQLCSILFYSILFYSILLSFLVNQQTLAQVVIEEEVVLDSPVGTESINLTMPFYGIVSIYFQPHATNTCGNFMNGTVCIKATVGNYQGTNSNNSACCGATGSCGGLPGQSPYTNTYSNIPMGTPVSLTIDWKVNGAWTPLNFWFVQSDNTYNMYSVDTSSGCPSGVAYLGYIKFVASNPPGCGTQVSCDNANIPQPNIELLEKPNGYDGEDICYESGTAAGFKPVGGNFFEPFNIEVCYNKQRQHWQFNFNNNNLLLKCIIDFCENNIVPLHGIFIEDYQNFPTNYGCENIIRDIENHYNYPVEIALGGGYLIKSILKAHENQHKQYFSNILNDLKGNFINEMYKEKKSCTEIHNAEDARIYFMIRLSQELVNYWDLARDRNYKETGLSDKEKGDEKLFWRHERLTQKKINKFIDTKLFLAFQFYNCFPL